MSPHRNRLGRVPPPGGVGGRAAAIFGYTCLPTMTACWPRRSTRCEVCFAAGDDPVQVGDRRACLRR